MIDYRDPSIRTDGPPVILAHQTYKENQVLLLEIAKRFERALIWDKKNVSELMEMVAEFEYLFAYCCPFMRGSVAICEWFSMGIYASHGLRVSYNPGKCINLEALTSSISEFISAYPSFVSLHNGKKLKDFAYLLYR